MTNRDWLFLALVCATPYLGYQFGIGNQVEQFTIVRRFLDRQFLPDDFYVNAAAQFGPRFYYAYFLSLAAKVAPLAAIIFVLTFISNFALAWVSYDTARRHLGAGALVGAIAALMVVSNSSFSLGLAGFLRFDSFQPASLAIPLSLIGVNLLLSERLFASAVAFSAAALFHPLIGVELGAITYAARALGAVFNAGSIKRAFPTVLRLAPSGLLFFAIILVIWGAPILLASAEGGRAGASEGDFFEILVQFRAPHHYLASVFPISHYLAAAGFIAASAYFALEFVRKNGAGQNAMTLIVAVIITLIACLASAIFVDVFHSRTFAATQIFRMLLIVKWVGFLFFAVKAGEWLSLQSPLAISAALMAMLATGDAQPIVLVLALITILAFTRVSLLRNFQTPAAVALAGICAVIALQFGARHEIIRAGACILCLGLLYGPVNKSLAARLGAIGIILALNIAAAINRDVNLTQSRAFSPTYSWRDLEGADVEIARWVRENTPREGIWATPPHFENFRLIGERAVIVDFTSIPFDGVGMAQWRKRINNVYGAPQASGFGALAQMTQYYKSLTPEKLAQIKAAYGAEWAVLYRETPWPDRSLFENEKFKAVKLR